MAKNAQSGLKQRERKVVVGLIDAMVENGFTCLWPTPDDTFNPHTDQMIFFRAGTGIAVAVSPMIDSERTGEIGNSLIRIVFSATDPGLDDVHLDGALLAAEDASVGQLRQRAWTMEAPPDSIKRLRGRPACFQLLLDQPRSLAIDRWAGAIKAACIKLLELQSPNAPAMGSPALLARRISTLDISAICEVRTGAPDEEHPDWESVRFPWHVLRVVDELVGEAGSAAYLYGVIGDDWQVWDDR